MLVPPDQADDLDFILERSNGESRSCITKHSG